MLGQHWWNVSTSWCCASADAPMVGGHPDHWVAETRMGMCEEMRWKGSVVGERAERRELPITFSLTYLIGLLFGRIICCIESSGTQHITRIRCVGLTIKHKSIADLVSVWTPFTHRLFLSFLFRMKQIDLGVWFFLMIKHIIICHP